MTSTGDGVPPLDVRHVSMSYRNNGGPPVQVVKEVSLSLNAGEIYVLLGPNGAGKSTLMAAIAGYRSVSSGEILVSGAPVRASGAVRKRIGFVPQRITLFEHLTAHENLKTFGAVYGVTGSKARKAADDLLKRLTLWDKRDRLASELSGGMRRRLHIAASLLHDPPLLLLDEPTAGLDERTKKDFRSLLTDLRDRGLAILLTTHELEEASAVADRVGMLVAGRMRAQGGAKDLNGSIFVKRRSVTMHMAAPIAQEQAQFLKTIGMGPSADGLIWSGLVEADHDLDRLMARLGVQMPAPREISVSHPDLRDLVDTMAEDDGAGGERKAS